MSNAQLIYNSQKDGTAATYTDTVPVDSTLQTLILSITGNFQNRALQSITVRVQGSKLSPRNVLKFWKVVTLFKCNSGNTIDLNSCLGCVVIYQGYTGLIMTFDVGALAVFYSIT